MLKDFVLNHVFMSSIFAVGLVSLLLQGGMSMFLKSYVQASANMKTTKKKLLISLKNQYEAMYGMDCQIRNTSAYLDKFLLKLKFMGISYAGWERVPFLSAGMAVLLAVAGIFYGYVKGAKGQAQMEILFSCGIVLACLFIFFHIYGIKSKKLQIQIQLVDYLENFMTNRLNRVREGREEMGSRSGSVQNLETELSADGIELSDAPDFDEPDMVEDMEMLKRLLSQVEYGKKREKTEENENPAKEDVPLQDDREENERNSDTERITAQIAASQEEEEPFPDVTYEAFSKEPEESELELLEEFVQSFLA